MDVENDAVTAVSVFMVIVHVPVPVHAPDHPSNVDPVSATAVRVTTVPSRNTSEQSEPQLIPAGSLVTVPNPPPVFKTVSRAPGRRTGHA